MAIKYFLVALDKNFEGFIVEIKENYEKINSRIETLNLWENYIKENKNEYIYLKDSEAKLCYFISKFTEFVKSLKDDDTGVLILNTHGKKRKKSSNTIDYDNYDEIFQLYDKWLIDDEIRKILSNHKNQNALFVSIIDTCDTNENFNKIKIDELENINYDIKNKNEIFYLASSYSNNDIQFGRGKFNGMYSIFAFEMLDILKNNQNISYYEWFIKVNEKIKSLNLTSQIPICITDSFTNLNQIVFFNNNQLHITSNTIIPEEIKLNEIGIFEGIFFHKIEQKNKNNFLDNLINVKQNNLKELLKEINIINKFKNQKI
jgi:hypothetical protein